MSWIPLAQDETTSGPLRTRYTILRSPYKAGNLITNWVTISFPWITPSFEVSQMGRITWRSRFVNPAVNRIHWTGRFCCQWTKPRYICTNHLRKTVQNVLQPPGFPLKEHKGNPPESVSARIIIEHFPLESRRPNHETSRSVYVLQIIRSTSPCLVRIGTKLYHCRWSGSWLIRVVNVTGILHKDLCWEHPINRQ